VLKSFIALCTNVVLDDANEVKKQFSNSTLIKNYIQSEKTINAAIIKESQQMLDNVKPDDVKRLSSTVYLF